MEMFQYNYCFGGTYGKKIPASPKKMFQYNYCFGGTPRDGKIWNWFSSFNTTIVSVEHTAKRYRQAKKKCFNTTIVSVELQTKII